MPIGVGDQSVVVEVSRQLSGGIEVGPREGHIPAASLLNVVG